MSYVREPSGNTQMAHSHFAILIVLSWLFKLMLLLCSIGFRLVTLVSTGPFQLPFTIVCSGMLTFAFACFDLVVSSFFVAPRGFLWFGVWRSFHVFPFVVVFLNAGFCFM